jgi:cytidine deaminase
MAPKLKSSTVAPETTPEQWKAYIQQIPELGDRARVAREKAIQHRGFKVGAAALALTAQGGSYTFTGANYMPKPRGKKICAEGALLKNIKRHNVHKAAEHRIVKVIGLVVSGPVQADKHSGIELPTLPPCGDCRKLLNASPLIADDTLIMQLHPDADMFELYTRSELDEIVGSVNQDVPPDSFAHFIDPEFIRWSEGNERFPLLLEARAFSPRLQASSIASIVRYATEGHYAP